VRTAADIDEAIAQDKSGIFVTHLGTALFVGDLDRVGLWRELGYGYCLPAYNSRKQVSDGRFEPDNGRLTGYGRRFMDMSNPNTVTTEMMRQVPRRQPLPCLSSRSGESSRGPRRVEPTLATGLPPPRNSGRPENGGSGPVPAGRGVGAGRRRGVPRMTSGGVET